MQNRAAFKSMNKTFFLVFALLLLFYSTASISGGEDKAMAEMNNTEVVQSIYKGFESGDMAAILNVMSEEIVWLHPGKAEQIPFAGRFEGKEGVQRFFDIAFSSIDVLDQQVFSFEGSGEKILVLGFEHMRVKATGKEYQSNWIHMYTVTDGKVVAFEEFIDTAALVSAFAPD